MPDYWMLFRDYNSEKKKAIQGSKDHPWDQKSNKIFWRGTDSGRSKYEIDIWSNLPAYFPRLELLRLSKEYPDIIDARFTRTTDNLEGKYEELGLYLMSQNVPI